MRSLLRMELLKLARRPMTWVLLALLLAGIGVGTLIAALNLPGLGPVARDAVLRNLTLPGAIPETLENVSYFGAILLAILAASSIGGEYGWGTLRPVLGTGVPRGRFLTAKLLALGLVATAFLLLAVVTSAALAVPVALLNGHAVFTGAVDAAWFGDLAAMLGRTLLTLLVPMALAFLFGTLGRSQAVGIGVALGAMLGDQVVVALLGKLDLAWSRTVIDLMLSTNNRALWIYNTFGAADRQPSPVGQGHALLTLLLYGAVCLGVSLAVFGRRDVRGAD